MTYEEFKHLAEHPQHRDVPAIFKLEVLETEELEEKKRSHYPKYKVNTYCPQAFTTTLEKERMMAQHNAQISNFNLKCLSLELYLICQTIWTSCSAKRMEASSTKWISQDVPSTSRATFSWKDWSWKSLSPTVMVQITRRGTYIIVSGIVTEKRIPSRT